MAAFSVAELDEGFGKAEAILAFQRDGQPLANEIGPFRLVVPSDKRGGRWVRNLIKLTVAGRSEPDGHANFGLP